MDLLSFYNGLGFVKKFSATTGIFLIVFWVVKPSSMFTDQGNPREFSIDPTSDSNSTVLPVYAAAPLLALCLNVLY